MIHLKFSKTDRIRFMLTGTALPWEQFTAAAAAVEFWAI